MSTGSSLHTKEHYRYARKISTPTHAIEGDYLPLSVEEALFGLLFGYLAFWAFKQFRNMMAYYRELKTLAGTEERGNVGVAIGEADGVVEGKDGEGGDSELEEIEEEDKDYAFIKRPGANQDGQKKLD